MTDRETVLRYLARSTPEPEVFELEDGRVSHEWYRGSHDSAVVVVAAREVIYSCLLPNGMKWSGRCQIGNRAALELFALRFGFTLGAP